MKAKRLVVFVLVVGCFIACFSYLNQKYDRFYRIAGIDNEKRQLILNYLDEDEQDYLVEHSFSTDRFMKYIEIEDFSLYNLTYYELMEKQQRVFLDDRHLVNYTNQIITKVRQLTDKNRTKYFKDIINNHLDTIFLQTDEFDLDLIGLYSVYMKEFLTLSIENLEQINLMNVKMTALNYTDSYKRTFLKEWQTTYDLVALNTFLDLEAEDLMIQLVNHPDSLTTVLTEQTTLSTYVPEPLVIPYDVSRVSFGMYLRQDACVALENMVDELKKEIPQETLLLIGAYQSYETLYPKVEQKDEFFEQTESVLLSQREFQLGLSIEVKEMDSDYALFGQTAIGQYLKENSWKYGFIQRYSSLEDMNYSDNIYRFVGKQAAKVIHEQQLSLEEYEGV